MSDVHGRCMVCVCVMSAVRRMMKSMTILSLELAVCRGSLLTRILHASSADSTLPGNSFKTTTESSCLAFVISATGDC